MERLRGILPRIVDEVRRALNAELEALNRAGFAEKLKLARRSQPRHRRSRGRLASPHPRKHRRWHRTRRHRIYSELALPAKDDLGAGSMTKRITTRRLAGVESTSQSYDKPAAAKSAPTRHRSGRSCPSNAARSTLTLVS
jgi:hypothetical protein